MCCVEKFFLLYSQWFEEVVETQAGAGEEGRDGLASVGTGLQTGGSSGPPHVLGVSGNW